MSNATIDLTYQDAPEQKSYGTDGPGITTSGLPEFRWITVNPDLARKWLDRYQGPNRNVSNKAVQKLAEDMKHGHWVDNGETIKFSRTNQLLDGQHRLHAVIEADVPIRFLVIAGLEPTVMRTIDTGRARSFADVLSIRGLPNSRRLAAAAKAVFLYEHGLLVGGGYPVTHAQLDEIIERHPFIVDAVKVVERAKWLQPAGIVSMVYTLAHEKNAPVADRWMDDVQSGVNLDAQDPAYLLRERLRDHESHRARMAPAYAAAYTIKSWNAYQAGRKLNVLSWRGTGSRAEDMPTIG